MRQQVSAQRRVNAESASEWPRHMPAGQSSTLIARRSSWLPLSGNAGTDLSKVVPASYPEVLTVTAIAGESRRETSSVNRSDIDKAASELTSHPHAPAPLVLPRLFIQTAMAFPVLWATR